jgi:iron complex transport system substrate-binding protein
MPAFLLGERNDTAMFTLTRRWTVALMLTMVGALMLAACVTVTEQQESGVTGDASNSATQTDEPADDFEVADVDRGPFPVTVTRSDGIDLTLESPPERVVSLSAGATEIFFAIGAGDRIAAVEIFSDYPPEALDLPRVDAFQPDPEAIVAHDPDLVLIIYNANDIVSTLDGLGVPALYLEAPSSLDGLLEQIELLGDVTGNVDEARDLVEALAGRIAAVRDVLADVESGPRIYHELDDTFFTVAPDSFIGDVYRTLKAENIAEGAIGEYPQLSEEAILDRDPEVIIVPSYMPDDDEQIERVRSRPGWDGIDAVANDRIYLVDGDSISRPGPRIIDVLEQLVELLYPERFETGYEPVFAPDRGRIAA